MQTGARGTGDAARGGVARLQGAELEEAVRDGVASGQSNAAMAHALGWSMEKIRTVRIAIFGSKVRALPVGRRRDAVAEFYAQGLTGAEICQRLAVVEPGLIYDDLAKIKRAEDADDRALENPVEACKAHLADLLHEHAHGAGELAIPPGEALYRPTYYGSGLSGGSPAGECADLGDALAIAS